MTGRDEGPGAPEPAGTEARDGPASPDDGPVARGEAGGDAPAESLERLEERLDALERRVEHQDVRQIIMEVRREISRLERKLEMVIEFLGPEAEPIQEGRPPAQGQG